MNAEKENKKDLTLVTQYADQKEQHFAEFVDYCIQKATKIIPSFEGYPPAQVHGTIIGLEVIEKGGQFYNVNYTRLCNRPRLLNFSEVVKFLKTEFEEGIPIRFGGFRLDWSYGFRPLNQHPYYRSFYLGTGRPMSGAIAGWPEGGQRLDRLRRDFQRIGIAEKWQARENRQVLDLFCVIGHVQQEANRFALADGAAQMRSFLSELDDEVQWVREILKPVVVTVSEETLAVVRYTDTRLPIGSSEALPVLGLTPESLHDFFSK